MAHQSEILWDEMGHVCKCLMSDGYSSQMSIGHEKEKSHAKEHNGTLKGIGIHDPTKPSPDNIGGDDDRIYQQSHMEVYG